MVHTKMASAEVVEDTAVDLDSQVPHNRIHMRLDRDHSPHLDWTLD